MWKPIGDLTEEDLQTIPVWEWKEASESEFVRPTSLTSLTEYRDGPVHIAVTRFTSACGDVYLGYCSPADARIDYTQPVVFTAKGPLPLWHGDGLSEAQRAAVSALGDELSTFFPIQVECLVPVDGALYAERVDAV